MRDRTVAFPFSLGCISHTSIAVFQDRPRRSKLSLKSPPFETYEDEDQESLSGESSKHSSRFSAFPKPNFSTGVNRLVKGFKSLSQLFIDEDEMDELGMEMEMEIGCPTDVKHVAHIGWDGTTTTHLTPTGDSPLVGWHHLFNPEILPHHRPPSPFLPVVSSGQPPLPSPPLQHHLGLPPSPPFPIASS